MLKAAAREQLLFGEFPSRNTSKSSMPAHSSLRTRKMSMFTSINLIIDIDAKPCRSGPFRACLVNQQSLVVYHALSTWHACPWRASWHQARFVHDYSELKQAVRWFILNIEVCIYFWIWLECCVYPQNHKRSVPGCLGHQALPCRALCSL